MITDWLSSFSTYRKIFVTTISCRKRRAHMKEALWKTAKIICGTFLMAMAVNFVYEPMNMVTGGISGLAIAVKAMTDQYVKGGIPVWLTNISVNIPIFIWGYYKKGKAFLGYTFLANLCFSIFLMVLPISATGQKDYFLSALVGGGLTGVGLGLVFAAGYSTGGTDLLSSILHSYFKSYSVASILFVLDALVILAGVLTFGIYTTVYAVLAVSLTTWLMDNILSGLKVGKQVWIISENYREISSCIIEQMQRGVTCLEGRGMFSGDSKKVLLCVVGKRQIPSLVRIVRGYDSSAFVIIQDAREVMGEGFGKMDF